MNPALPHRPQRYRPEIDGLRAIAIVPVVLYHAWPALAPGGFVGVDVFFVISGYLITQIITASDFSFVEFYRRRVRRIFPALLAVFAATLVAGYWLLPPDDFRNLLRYAIGGSLFGANVVAYTNDSYFSGASELKPLVHLWSLGVEEQFYLMWPAAMVLAARRRVLAPVVFLTGVVSLAIFLWFNENDPRAAFYLAPSRVWELLVGAALAIVGWKSAHRNAASFTGLVLIAGSVMLIDSRVDFPGSMLLFPVLGTALVIAAPESSFGSRLLSNRALVWVGLISYPLYLWHWPLLALLRHYERSPSSLAIASAAGAAVLLAELTRRYVERPLQSFRLGPTAAALAACMVATLGATTVSFMTTAGETRELTNATCTRRYPYQAPSLWFCTLSKPLPPTILLLGDSHANHLYPGLARALASETVLSIGACMPTQGLVYPERRGAANTCSNEDFAVQSSFLHDRVIVEPSIKEVIISAMWPAFDQIGNEINYASGKTVSTFSPAEPTALRSFVAALERQIVRLGDRPVTIVLGTPRRGVAVDLQRRRQEPLRAEISALAARHPNVRVFDPMALMCSAHWCQWNLLADANHLSGRGSDALAEAMFGR